jgi:hypothetical protein
LACALGFVELTGAPSNLQQLQNWQPSVMQQQQHPSDGSGTKEHQKINPNNILVCLQLASRQDFLPTGSALELLLFICSPPSIRNMPCCASTNLPTIFLGWFSALCQRLVDLHRCCFMLQPPEQAPDLLEDTALPVSDVLVSLQQSSQQSTCTISSNHFACCT